MEDCIFRKIIEYQFFCFIYLRAQRYSEKLGISKGSIYYGKP